MKTEVNITTKDTVRPQKLTFKDLDNGEWFVWCQYSQSEIIEEVRVKLSADRIFVVHSGMMFTQEVFNSSWKVRRVKAVNIELEIEE